MILLKGEFPVPSQHQPEALDLIQAFASASLREPGCLAFEVYLQPDRPGQIIIWQQWASRDALEQHFASDLLDDFLDRIADLIDGDVMTTRWDVAGDLDDLEHEAVSSPVLLGDEVVLH